ncbi:MAG: hypothetical protein PVI73_17630, partial [Syntrophobacterales bacterium]
MLGRVSSLTITIPILLDGQGDLACCQRIRTVQNRPTAVAAVHAGLTEDRGGGRRQAIEGVTVGWAVCDSSDAVGSQAGRVAHALNNPGSRFDYDVTNRLRWPRVGVLARMATDVQQSRRRGVVSFAPSAPEDRPVSYLPGDRRRTTDNLTEDDGAGVGIGVGLGLPDPGTVVVRRGNVLEPHGLHLYAVLGVGVHAR